MADASMIYQNNRNGSKLYIKDGPCPKLLASTPERLANQPFSAMCMLANISQTQDKELLLITLNNSEWAYSSSSSLNDGEEVRNVKISFGRFSSIAVDVRTVNQDVVLGGASFMKEHKMMLDFQSKDIYFTVYQQVYRSKLYEIQQ